MTGEGRGGGVGGGRGYSVNVFIDGSGLSFFPALGNMVNDSEL